ncbi:predicted protein [Uncinocarpus reesii 1704]|uniref:N-acetylgalactosaminide beta-1,3-galactosyltransferase n=1 Tax=Uncinocarpus reesii (strain UAMH 1704) TaxID=336963 RepID=C4JQP0_UNCRE|nr:uncharacterized protein UREG_03385 [Uncinocarpus reesii 1704]EEP78539.1 predicted protein [Uncinocarpus reesii 1704]
MAAWITSPRKLRLIYFALVFVTVVVVIYSDAIDRLRFEFVVRKYSPCLPQIDESSGPSGPIQNGDQSALPNCETFSTSPFARDGIQVVLKIGGAESRERLKSHVDGVTACIPNLLVVSDMEQVVGPFRAHDVIRDVMNVLSREDRKTYQRQRENYCYRNDKEPKPTPGGWKLDKYKFFPMVEYAYRQNPHAKWYVFTETDTFVIWDNLVQLLGRYNWTDPLYMGSPTPGRTLGQEWGGRKSFFAYGGSGFVLSAAAMEILLQGQAGDNTDGSQLLTSKYRKMIRGDCCGDSVLGWVAAQHRINVTGLWPMFDPAAVHDTPLGRTSWCQPAISFHRTKAPDTLKLWRWLQEKRKDGMSLGRPILFSDLVDFLGILNVAFREDWKNTNAATFEKQFLDSFESCRAACHDHPECLQFSYHHRRCHLVREIDLGNPAEPEGDGDSQHNRWLAGWDVEKIKRFQEAHPCGQVDWPAPSLDRIF